jgi:hypothetical protein
MLMTSRKYLLFLLIFTVSFGGLYRLFHEKPLPRLPKVSLLNNEEEDEGSEMEQENGRKRAAWEFNLLRDPRTGKIPEGIRAREIAWAKKMPVRNFNYFNNTSGVNQMNAPEVANKYIAVGPTQNGGRTRALAFDMRYNGSSNKVILTGGINGGIFRSIDGGATWAFVHPENEIRSVSCLAQDPRPGFQDTWYAGTGEPIGTSAAYPNAFVFGNGILKSTDNGATWNMLPSTADNDPTVFSEFDIVGRIAVHPLTGDIYAAVQRRIMRSKDGGSTWSTVLIGTTPTNTVGGVMEIMINNAGTKLFAAVSGRNPDRNFAGIYTSSSGSTGSWTRIAGGLNGQADSVAGWQAYDNSSIDGGGNYSAGWGRIVLTLAPSNQNILYALCENGNQATNLKTEADLFRCDLSTNTWARLSDNLLATRTVKTTNTTKYFEAQGGYNLSIAVHPTQPSIVFVAGVNLFKSTDGFTTPGGVSFVGGLASDTYTDANGASHVDIHGLVFDPSNPNRLITASDGGVTECTDVTASKLSWNLFNSQYQTIQYYHVGIDPTKGSRAYYGGAQDNSTTLRDIDGAYLGSALPDSNDHYILLGGDGGKAAMTTKNVSGNQYLFASAQEGQIYRLKLFPPYDNSFYTLVKPAAAGKGEFVTYYHLDEDNTDLLYFASSDTLYRATSSTTVTTSSGWTRMNGISGTIGSSIFSMATTRGGYTANNYLFIGTAEGKVFRLKDPQGVSPAVAPEDITPPGMVAGSVVFNIALNPRNQDTMMCVVTNYDVPSVFWTGNATASNPTWQTIEGNLTLPSVRSCAIVAKTTGVEYYVGTSAGLYSTASISGSSTTWSREGIGPLANAIVNSLAYRWNDNTLLVGTHGNGMFVTYIGDPITLSTGITTPIRDDKNFIRGAYPTLVDQNISFQIGNMYTIKQIQVQVHNISGQLLYNRSSSYQNGTVDMSTAARGEYILTVTSNDRKYQFVRKFVKQ